MHRVLSKLGHDWLIVFRKIKIFLEIDLPSHSFLRHNPEDLYCSYKIKKSKQHSLNLPPSVKITNTEDYLKSQVNVPIAFARSDSSLTCLYVFLLL